MIRMNINLSQSLREKLEIESEREGVTLSAYIRKACEHWLETHSMSSGLSHAKQGIAKWKYLRYGRGVYFIEDSTGNMVRRNGRRVELIKRETGSAGAQSCMLCGEKFDAGIGSYFDLDSYLCGRCGEVLRARTRALLAEQENQEDLKAIAAVLDEPTTPWLEVKARLKGTGEVQRAG